LIWGEKTEEGLGNRKDYDVVVRELWKKTEAKCPLELMRDLSPQDACMNNHPEQIPQKPTNSGIF
jgi:hypothetical protein